MNISSNEDLKNEFFSYLKNDIDNINEESFIKLLNNQKFYEIKNDIIIHSINFFIELKLENRINIFNIFKEFNDKTGVKQHNTNMFDCLLKFNPQLEDFLKIYRSSKIFRQSSNIPLFSLGYFIKKLNFDVSKKEELIDFFIFYYNNIDTNNILDRNISIHFFTDNLKKYNIKKEDIFRLIKSSSKRKFFSLELTELLKKNKELNFNMKEIIQLLDFFDIHQSSSMNLIDFLVSPPKTIDFDINDFVCILEKTLKYSSVDKISLLKNYISYRKTNDFIKNEEILFILEKMNIDFNKRIGIHIFEFLCRNGTLYNDDLKPKIIGKIMSQIGLQRMDILGKKNIFIYSLKSGVCFDDKNLVKKILASNDKKVINTVYNHINQIKWKHEELLDFIKQNSFKMTDDILKLI